MRRGGGGAGGGAQRLSALRGCGAAAHPVPRCAASPVCRVSLPSREVRNERGGGCVGRDDGRTTHGRGRHPLRVLPRARSGGGGARRGGTRGRCAAPSRGGAKGPGTARRGRGSAARPRGDGDGDGGGVRARCAPPPSASPRPSAAPPLPGLCVGADTKGGGA